MNANELSTLLGIHENTVRRLIKEGKIEATKKGRAYVILPDEVNRLLSEKKTTARMAIESISFVIRVLENELNKAEEFYGSEQDSLIDAFIIPKRFLEVTNAKEELEKLKDSYDEMIRQSNIDSDEELDISKPVDNYFLPKRSNGIGGY